MNRSIFYRTTRWFRLSAGLPLALVLMMACGGGDSQTADTGGIGGSGISQGTISSFGSIFVNGVEWDLTDASIELDGGSGTDADLRIGMNVRVVGDFDTSGLSGKANSVEFDDSIEGPISDLPMLILPGGTQKTFTILEQTIIVDQANTVFADGASFDGLAMDQVMEVSGFEEDLDTIRATRISLRGAFPAVLSASRRGVVANLTKNNDGSGIFEIAGVTIRYLASTEFSDLSRGELDDGLTVDVRGDLRLTGNELDAEEIESEEEGLGQENAEQVEVEGIVSNFVSLSDFEVAGVPVDAGAAVLEPTTLVVADGLQVEVEGRLEAGIIQADTVENEEDEDGEVAIRASVTATTPAARELTILGVVVVADGKTELEDERDGDESFEFGEIQVGDWLEIEGFEVGPARVLAKQIQRNSVDSDVVLRGPVTALDRLAPSLSVLEQPIPLAALIEYFDSMGAPRTETEFFRTPGDVSLGSDVEVRDDSAMSPDILMEADEIELD
jgi:hypothetical protein